MLYLYAWSITMTGLAVALRFVPYSESNGHLNAGWAILMGALLLGLGASVYLVYVLEILKLRRLRVAAAQGGPGHLRARDRLAASRRTSRLGSGEFPGFALRGEFLGFWVENCEGGDNRVGYCGRPGVLYRRRSTSSPTPGGEQEDMTNAPMPRMTPILLLAN